MTLIGAARVGWRFRTPLLRLTVGVRAAGKGARSGTWRLFVDGNVLKKSETTPDGDGTPRFLAEVDLKRSDAEREHLIQIESTGDAELLVRDAVVRARGFGDDPIGDELLIEEGRYWSEWVGAHRDAGDESISDGRVKGTHPSFLPIGVREPDRRDQNRNYGAFPDVFSDFILTPPAEKRGGIGLDIGAGCGQFALEVARRGVRMIGVDLGAGLLRIARTVAREREKREPGLRLDYVRAEGDRLPFVDGAFDVVTSKEALHHLRDVRRAFGEIRRVMTDDGLFVSSEHAFASRSYDRLLQRTTLFFRPLILRRWPAGPIADVMHHPSPMEDSGNNDVPAAFAESFFERKTRPRWIYVDFMEMHIHYAFGRLRWLFGPPLMGLAWAIEWGIRLTIGRPLGIGMIGRGKRGTGKQEAGR